jgi:hypothetical protein
MAPHAERFEKFSLILVLATKNVVIFQMTKVQKISRNISPFAGVFLQTHQRLFPQQSLLQFFQSYALLGSTPSK